MISDRAARIAMIDSVRQQVEAAVDKRINKLQSLYAQKVSLELEIYRTANEILADQTQAKTLGDAIANEQRRAA